ncbi:MAG TPA: carboxymuconolactone decarboxylase family protein [Candidatus Baltobacteraceae bacterium]|jgi:AhpD family alkylhydroperoxidase
MTQRLDPMSVAPQAVAPLFELGKAIGASNLEKNLLVLIQLRASQMNGCAFCLALHVREGKALGEADDRLYGVAAWREAPWYDDRERAALEWTESLTDLSNHGPGDELYARVKEHFSEPELVYLTLAVAAINVWNRFNVAFRTSPARAEAAFQQLHGQTHAHTRG